ncbi:MAG: hypothetical protein NC225_10645 [Clostridium sp.]|nr:hypothetical protein [Clostridium sp.]MCM1460726.1 hypothetical protein [Bacteroides sp.]
MSIFEYDAELHEKTLKETGFSNDKITEALINNFSLSPEDAQKYLTQTDK